MNGFSFGSIAKTIVAAVPLGGYLPAETWARRHRLLVRLTWAHAAVIALLGPLLGYDWELSLPALFDDRSVVHTACEGLVVAGFALLAGWRRLNPSIRAAAVGMGLVTASAIFVHTSGGYIELHFHFFVVLTFIALYQDWLPFGATVLFVALHHGTVGIFSPEQVYNHAAAIDAPWTWAAIHAFFVLFSCVGSMIAWKFNEQMVRDRISDVEAANATSTTRLYGGTGLGLAISKQLVELMGVQMPEMDGIQATAKIRDQFGDRRPWIIALTANALQGDRERYLGVGMDDYISKPIRVEALAQALGRCQPLKEMTSVALAYEYWQGGKYGEC